MPKDVKDPLNQLSPRVLAVAIIYKQNFYAETAIGNTGELAAGLSAALHTLGVTEEEASAGLDAAMLALIDNILDTL